jgi:hypothetical protein
LRGDKSGKNTVIPDLRGPLGRHGESEKTCRFKFFKRSDATISKRLILK